MSSTVPGWSHWPSRAVRPPPPWWSASARRGSPAGLRRSPDEHGPRPAFRLHDASWLQASRLRFAHFLLLPYAPGWSMIVIALDLFVIWTPAAYRDPGRAPGDARRRP
ncbi:DUF7144 family membrane protein [Streptomyces sp. C11-1]